MEKSKKQETITCKKFGKLVKVDIDHEKNEASLNQLAYVFNKNKCVDIFRDIQYILNEMGGKEQDGQERV